MSKCPIHKERKLFLYIKRGARIPNENVPIGKQCITCLVAREKTRKEAIK